MNEPPLVEFTYPDTSLHEFHVGDEVQITATARIVLVKEQILDTSTIDGASFMPGVRTVKALISNVKAAK